MKTAEYMLSENTSFWIKANIGEGFENFQSRIRIALIENFLHFNIFIKIDIIEKVFEKLTNFYQIFYIF